MSELEEAPRTYSGALLAAIAVAVLLGVGGLIWTYTLSGKVTTQQQELADAKSQNTNLAAQLRETDERLNVATDELKTSLGLTQKQLDARAQELQVRQAREEQASARLASEQKQTAQQVTAVTSAVTDVKTDVGGVKTQVATTQADLAATKTQMTSMMGDEGRMSGLIATNHDQLEELKHKGDRNYYEFTLHKGAPAQNVGTIKLQLKKVDVKRSKFTLGVSSDDKNIEKKDKNLDEPVQFYSGKTPALFEIVVNNISKNQVTGYLSTPKSAPAPIAVP